jgi:oligoribonuclease NrnB/cAMP/cGMP phosphodiesterase (DHH superfamily)
MSEKPICIYHGNCADGFGAAWVVRKFFCGDVDFVAGVYQTPPPEVTDRHVILVDFSYKRPVMLELAKYAKGVLVIDHHKSAAEDLAGSDSYFTDTNTWSGVMDWPRFVQNCYQDRYENIPVGRIYTRFDMSRSGAGMAWDFFFPNEERPALINRIEDRDLWRFAHADTRAVQAAVFSYPYDFEVWDFLFKLDIATLRTEGEAIERKHHKDIAELVNVCRRDLCIAGHRVPAASLPYTFTSDAGHLMCEPISTHNGDESPPFAACYWDTPKGRVFSLRSREGGMDVSEIAKQYGGGGHRNASGFTVSYDVARTFEIAP